MNKRANTAFAGFALVCCFAVFSVMLYLVYLFPRTVKLWEELDRDLSVFERSIVELSRFFKQFGFSLFPLILLLVAGSFAWLIISLRTKHQCN